MSMSCLRSLGLLVLGLGLACGGGGSGGDSGATGPTSGESGDGDGDGDGQDEASTSEEDDGEPRFDVGASPDVEVGGCGGGGGEIEFSNAWAANTGDNTVSKINTFTVQEEGRYMTQPLGVAGGSPSRTSVSLNGTAAVANRGDQDTPGASGITAIAAQEEDCIDRDMDGQITTSQGFDDVLPWGEDECILWHTGFDERSNRPVAWTAGDLNEATCKYEDAKVWTGTSVGHPADTTHAKVYLLDGETGEIEDEVVLDGWCVGDDRTIYGGAVDSNDDFWFVGAYTMCLGHVRMDDMTWEVIQGGSTPYGMIVDNEDRPWKANGTMSRYDPQNGTWQTASCNQGCTALAQSPDGDIWLGGVSGDPYIVIRVDPETMQVLGGLTPAQVPGLEMPWGLSFDAEGYLWAIEMGQQVYKIDVDTAESWVFDNNTFMYTYSDFTGFGLKNVAGDPG
jgi:hypothetical protein